MLNDDLTPMEYVVGVLYGCFQHDELMSTKIMIMIHQKGSMQIITGNQDVLLKVADYIEDDAWKNKFPFKLRVSPS